MIKVVLLSVLSMACLVSQVSAKVSMADEIFESGSDFMKGFETGVLMRSKDGQIEDFGCSIPDHVIGEEAEKIFDTVRSAFQAAKAMHVQNLDETDTLGASLDMLEEFMVGLQKFMMIIGPGSSEYLDNYCRGMVFGLQGSKMLVRIANTMMKDFNLSSLKKKLDGSDSTGKP